MLPARANANVDPDCKPKCGNGAIEVGETCDPPNSCKACKVLATCSIVEAKGSAETCDLACDQQRLTECVTGDGCCPAECSRASDNDCPMACGNGKLDLDETCEDGTSMPCPNIAEGVSHEMCKSAQLNGSAANCDAICVTTTISELRQGDGCCPQGGNANIDDDCQPDCGNKIIEPGEDCDGTLGCNASCKASLSPAQVSCLSSHGGTTDACATCACMKCAEAENACLFGEDAMSSQLCKAALDCSRSHACAGLVPCYCGTMSAPCQAPNGPCTAEIAGAAGTNDYYNLLWSANTPDTPIGKAALADKCRVEQRQTECR